MLLPRNLRAKSSNKSHARKKYKPFRQLLSIATTKAAPTKTMAMSPSPLKSPLMTYSETSYAATSANTKNPKVNSAPLRNGPTGEIAKALMNAPSDVNWRAIHSKDAEGTFLQSPTMTRSSAAPGCGWSYENDRSIEFHNSNS